MMMQIVFPLLYAIGRDGIAKKKLTDRSNNLMCSLRQSSNSTPPPSYDPKEPFQMLVADLGYSAYMGRLAIGRVVNGNVSFMTALCALVKRMGKHPTRSPRFRSMKGNPEGG
jgi:GTP-binding protein